MRRVLPSHAAASTTSSGSFPSGGKGVIYEKIRKDGFAALVGDRFPDLAGVSAPVFKAGGDLAGAVTLTMPASRFHKNQVEPVKHAARAISEKLGFS